MEITKHMVQTSIELAASQAMDRLASDEITLHRGGFHQWSAITSTVRTRIEKIRNEAINAIEEDREFDPSQL